MAYSATFNFNPNRGQHEQDVYYVRVSPSGGAHRRLRLQLVPRQHLLLLPQRRLQLLLHPRRRRPPLPQLLQPLPHRYFHAQTNTDAEGWAHAEGSSYSAAETVALCCSRDCFLPGWRHRRRLQLFMRRRSLVSDQL